MLNFKANDTDQYQFRLSIDCFKQGVADDRAIFDYFFRKLSLDSGYALFVGLNDVIGILELCQKSSR